MSVFDNIAIGTRASQAQVEVAARQASLHADVLELAEGYATLLGPGVLTPGQEQRLNLARTLVRNCPIYVLDNPTSAQVGCIPRAPANASTLWVKPRGR